MDIVVLAALQIAGLVAIGLSYHKLSSILAFHRKAALSDMDNVFQQLEALQGIYAELELKHALPPTRGWAASPDFLLNVARHALTRQATNVLECSSGISTLILARCMEKLGRGHVYSLEHDPVFAEKTRANLRHHGLDKFATVLDAPLRELQLSDWNGKWYDKDVVPAGIQFDLLVVDGPPQFIAKMARYPAVPVFYSRLSASAAVYLDDAARPDEMQEVQSWLAKHPDLALLDVAKCEKGCTALQKSA